jgi:hypothetical protein
LPRKSIQYCVESLITTTILKDDMRSVVSAQCTVAEMWVKWEKYSVCAVRFDT